MRNCSIAIYLIPALLFGCSQKDSDDPLLLDSESPNILLIIADDLGKDAIAGYSEGSTKAGTPTLDSLRSAGLTFTNFWAYPTCSPTRASIITGKYGYRTGVKWAGDALSGSESILHNHIQVQTGNKYATALIGKWHLSADTDSSFNPENLGMDYYAGLLRGATGYTEWSLAEDGISTNQSAYITEKFTELSISWIQKQEKPWFLWLAYTAPHTPFHLPPAEMHSKAGLPEYAPGLEPLPYYLAAIEAMDYQIGRLMDNIPLEERENTLVIFLADNGAPSQAAQSPYTRTKTKGTLYQGGINTPMFISGKGVSRTGTDDNLITSSDLFATICEIAGVATGEYSDSKSFMPLLTETGIIRDFQYSEMNDGTTDAWAIRNSRFKLIVSAGGDEEMFDLLNDPYENNDLLDGTLTAEETTAKMELETELARIRN